jgi:hypothetical protein
LRRLNFNQLEATNVLVLLWQGIGVRSQNVH